jgi:hypothetical protein
MYNKYAILWFYSGNWHILYMFLPHTWEEALEIYHNTIKSDPTCPHKLVQIFESEDYTPPK